MNWYYADKGSQVGPVSEDEFRALVKKGIIASATLVWNSTMTDWQKYGDVVKKEKAGPLKDDGIAETSHYNTCVECGKTFSQDDMIQYEDSWVCATCKPIFVQKIKEGVRLAGAMEYAGFWIRFGAKVIDGIILWVINTIISVGLGVLMTTSSTTMQSFSLFGFSYLLQVAVGAAYTTWFLGKYGATVGKMACKIKVVTSDGEPISYLRALGRHFAEWLSALILLIGYIIAAFDDEKRALHDRICDTRVIRK
jgi:uncharacterized RDD family membrane protein YckC